MQMLPCNDCCEKLFSVVVLHYAQNELWKQTVDSVLMQDYPALELVFADDASPGFDVSAVEAYVRARAQKNLVSLKVFSNEENIGTVANLRAAHARCSGIYLTQISADDVYAGAGVLSVFAQQLERKPEDVLGVYGQSLLCSAELVPDGTTYFQKAAAIEMNGMDAKGQLSLLSLRCCIPMGATAFLFREYPPFALQDGYRLMEDWPFFVRAALAGKRFLFCGTDALLYRDGGVSRSSGLTPARRFCFIDTLRLFENELFPNLSLFDIEQQKEIYYRYNQERIDTERVAGEKLSEKSRIRLLLPHGRLLRALLGDRIRNAKKVSAFLTLWFIGVLLLSVSGRPFGAILQFTVAVLACWAALQFLRGLLGCIVYLFSRRK